MYRHLEEIFRAQSSVSACAIGVRGVVAQRSGLSSLP